jgi:hypothetical protein
MSMPLSSPRSAEAEIARAQTEATRIRAEASKAIVVTVMRAVLPLGIFGIALGATAVIFRLADPALHLVGLLVVWIGATLVGTLAVLGSIVETHRLNWKRWFGERPMQLEVNEAKRLAHSIQE